MKKKRSEIDILQDNLTSLRKIAGWTLEEMGNKLGVTKQTMSNLESNKTPMSQPQCIAITAVLANEIEQTKSNSILKQAFNLLLINGDELSEQKYEELKDMISTIAGGAKKANIEPMFNTLVKGLGLATLAVAPVVGIAAIGLMLKKLNDK